MIEKATNRELTAAFKAHLLGRSPKGTKCPAINGIIKEANEIAGECDDKKTC